MALFAECHRILLFVCVCVCVEGESTGRARMTLIQLTKPYLRLTLWENQTNPAATTTEMTSSSSKGKRISRFFCS